MIVQILSLVIVGVIVVYYLKKEKVKNDRYFGKEVKYSRKEMAILDHYKRIYNPIPNDERLARIEREGYYLEDVALTATTMIYDQPIPTIAEIDRLRVGDNVKLLFTDEDGAVERMWVEILKSDNRIFKGYLANEAVGFDNLPVGSIVYFHSNNIFDIDSSE